MLKNYKVLKRVTKDKRQFILTWVQPGLAGLMDGSVSTLAPILATAFATGQSYNIISWFSCLLELEYQWDLLKLFMMME